MTHDEKPPAVVEKPLEIETAPQAEPMSSGDNSGKSEEPKSEEPKAVADGASGTTAEKKKAKRGHKPNNVRRIRIERMMSKAELARRANLSVLTIDRVEKGFGSRMGTKRKILEALGLSLADRVRVFGEEE